MRLILFSLLFITVSASSIAQGSDFITVKKKNNRTIKSFFPGSLITFRTVNERYFSGKITAIKNDSVFILQYDIVPNNWGVNTVDTLGTYILSFHYKEIKVLTTRKSTSFAYLRHGTIFIIGGLGYAALNIINGKYLHEPVTSRENLKKLGIAFTVAGGGFIMKYLNNRNQQKEMKYRVEYIRMNTRQSNFF